jgi:outer membrane lipoprotein LolB
MIALRYSYIIFFLLLMASPETKATTSKHTHTEKATTKKDKAANSRSTGASRISSWEISGAMAARARNKGWNASLNWHQRGQGQYHIRLSGPVGSGTVIISRSGGMVTLRDGSRTTSSPNAESLLRQQTGIYLPVSKLYYWVRGIPAPGGIQSEKRDPAGRLISLRQGGYSIDYPRYTATNKAVLPTSIRLQGNGVSLKLVINRWRV